MDVKSNQSPLIKINAALADEVCAHFDLAEESRALLRDDMRPREFVEALLKNEQYQVGIDFLAYALPVREAIWWGCLCLQHVGGNGPSAAERAANTATVYWVFRPTENNRVAAKSPARTAGPGTPAGALALAVTQTRETAAKCGRQFKWLDPDAPAKTVANAIKLASERTRVGITDTQRSFVELGVGVAEARFEWPEIGSEIPSRR
jgi:hypothetical protein